MTWSRSSTTSSGLGGACYFGGSATSSFRDCYLTSNAATSGGAIYAENNSISVVDSCFLDNTGGIELLMATADITNTDFTGHTSPA